MEIRKLKPIEWVSLIDIFDREFNSDLPSPNKSEIIGVFEDERLAGFVLTETVTFVGLIYVKEPKKNATIARKMIRYVREKTDAQESVACVASEPRFEMLFRTLGMEKIPGTLFRRNAK